LEEELPAETAEIGWLGQSLDRGFPERYVSGKHYKRSSGIDWQESLIELFSQDYFYRRFGE